MYNSKKIIKRKEMYIIEKLFTYKLVIPFLKYVSKTNITPNGVTILNILNGIIILINIRNKNNKIAAILILLYLFLDILDGNLARYLNKESKFGAKLDNYTDRVMYNLFIIFIGLKSNNYFLLILLTILHNLHGGLATFYIVPKIKNIKNFNRFGIKKILMEKGIILGMDLSMLNIILAIALIVNKLEIGIFLSCIFYFLDILYRYIELRINLRRVI